MVEWANFGTINIDAGASVSQHFSLFAGVKFNPWKFETAYGMPVYNNQTTVHAGARYWPWYVYSGWWLGAKLKYTDFAETGVLRPKLFKGNGVAAGASFGYTWMLSKHLNLELGAGVCAGRLFECSCYRTAKSMVLLSSAPRNYVYIDDVALTLMYVF